MKKKKEKRLRRIGETNDTWEIAIGILTVFSAALTLLGIVALAEMCCGYM